MYLFGVASTTRDTITKLRYRTVDNKFLIMCAVSLGLGVILVAILICYVVPDFC